MFELTKRQELLCTISDLHKDARGFRPNLEKYEDQTEVELIAEIGWLGLEAQEAMDREEAAAQACARDMQATVAINILSGAGTARDGVRWILEAQDEEFTSPLDVEGWVWAQGFLFTKYGKWFVETAQSIISEKIMVDFEDKRRYTI